MFSHLNYSLLSELFMCFMPSVNRGPVLIYAVELAEVHTRTCAIEL